MRDLLGFLVADCCAGSPEICSPLAEVIRTACCDGTCDPETTLKDAKVTP
jgi:hypothetical protein